MKDERATSLMDRGASAWIRAGDYMKLRPIQFIGTFIGLVAIVFILIFNVTTSVTNSRDIDIIKTGVCSRSINSSQQQNKRCQQLLTELLRNPTPEQTRRLRELIETETRHERR